MSSPGFFARICFSVLAFAIFLGRGAPVWADQSAALKQGSGATISVTADGTQPFSYQWRKDSVNIPGATSPTYSITNLQPADAGVYSVLVSNAAGSTVSDNASISIINPPVITSEPSSALVSTGATTSFTVGATNASSYSWQVSSDGGATWITLTDDGTFSGTTTNTLTVSNSSPGLNSLWFRATASGGGGGVVSSAFSLRVADSALVSPVDVAATAAGPLLVSDPGIDVIHSVSTSGLATVLAGVRNFPGALDGNGANALFRQPAGVAIDGAGNLFVADSGNSLIRRITPAGAVTTIAGSEFNKDYRDGTGSNAWFNMPSGIAIDSGGTLYVADTGNSVIRKVTSSGTVTTLAGAAGVRGSADGTGAAARFNQPVGITVDGSGNVFVADSLNQTIRKITSAGVVTTFAGLPGVAGFADGNAVTQALFNRPTGVTVDGSGTLFVADTGNSVIRRISAAGSVSTLAGIPTISGLRDGTGTNAWFNQPAGLRLASGGVLLVADTGNAAIRRVSSAGAVTTVMVTAATIPDFPTAPPNQPVTAPTPSVPLPPTLPTNTPAIEPPPELPTSTPTIPTAPALPSTTPTIPPAPGGSGSGGGGGGGAPSAWFVLALAVAALLRGLRRETR